MLDDFTPIIHNLPPRTAKLFPIADVHIGAKEADIKGFASFLKSVEEDEDSYICIAGDLINNGIRSANCPTDIYQEVLSPSASCDLAVELLQPVADRILGVVGGNHELRSRKQVDLDPLYEICARLKRNDAERTSLANIYRPDMAFMRIILKGETSTRDTYSIMMTHGKSTAKRNKFTAIVEGVDACVYAHTHQPDVSYPTRRLRFNNRNTVSYHDVLCVTCCSWLQPGGYSLQSLYTPQISSRPQCLIMEFTGRNDVRGRMRVGW